MVHAWRQKEKYTRHVGMDDEVGERRTKMESKAMLIVCVRGCHPCVFYSPDRWDQRKRGSMS